MDRNIVSGFGVVFVQGFVQRFDVVVQAGPSHALDGNYADRIFIAHGQRVFRIERRFFQAQGHGTHFDLPQLTEFFPYDLETGRNDEVRFVVRFALRFAFRTPAQPCGYAAQHTGFGRADRQRAGFPLRLFGRIPQVGHDVDATGGHDGYARIFRFVDVVHVDRFVHQLGGVIVHVGRYECGEVQSRLRLRERFILHHLVGDFRSGGLHRNLFRRS